MSIIDRLTKTWIQILLIGTLVLGLTGCGWLQSIVYSESFPAVESLPLPELPDWIEQISPTGEVETLAQIRIRFKEPLIPVERLDSPEQQELLKKFEIVPPLPGHFRFLTPRLVGFQADRAIPKATRVRVTLKAGLADLQNHRLDQDLAWTFNTESIEISFPDWENKPIELDPVLTVNANVELDLASARQQVSLMPEGQDQPLPLRLALKDEDTTDADRPGEKFGDRPQGWTYTLTPQQSLEKATPYRLAFAPALRPAQGNLPTETSFAGQFETYRLLAFQELQSYGEPGAGGAYGRFVQGAPQLTFNNGLVAESAIANITVNPPPKDDPPLVRAFDGDRIVNLNPWALEPDTTYQITLGADLKDEFGQTLGKPVPLSYNTGDLAPEIWAPGGLNIFPAGQDLQLHVTAVNLPEDQYRAAYRVVQPTDLVYADSAYPRGKGGDLLPDPAVWENFPVSGTRNQVSEVTVPLREQLETATGMLAYGVTARTNRYEQDGQERWREPRHYGLVQLTNLGIFAQWFPESGLVRVHRLSDGATVANAGVEIYQSQLEEPVAVTPRPCAAGQTDATGTLLLDREALQGCMDGDQNFTEPPELLVIARQEQDWAFVRTYRYSGAYSYGITAGWDDGQPLARGTLFSDRQLYQPGETAWFTGVAYSLQNDELQQDNNTRYTVTLTNPSGEDTDLGAYTTNDFGTFSLELPLDQDQPLGFYTIRAQAESGVEISGEFRVAEFKPPNFKVDLSLNREFALAGETVEAATQSNYLFGPPVQQGQAAYYVTREQTNFTPQGWEEFSFGRQWFWPEDSPAVASDVLQVSQLLDTQGQDQQAVTVAEDLPYPMTYRVDVEVADVSNLSVSDSQTFTTLPSDRLIGLNSDFVANAGQPFPIAAIVTDPTGKAISGQRVRIELQEMRYSSVTQVIEGSRTQRNQVEYTTVASTEIRSTARPQSVRLRPPESGSYRVRANFVDAENAVTATDTQIWATGTAAVDWGSRYRNNRLEIKLDQDRYQPGETATALIQSPDPEAELYFAVVRHDTLYQQMIKVRGGAPQVQFQVTPEMLPNAAVEAVLVRQGSPLSQGGLERTAELARIGFAPFQVALDDRYLRTTVTPTTESLQPGEEQTVRLELRDRQNQPVQGQFTVMVVNEAVLQLTGYRPPDLVKTVFADQEIATRFADNRPDVVLEPLASPLEKGWGYGGGQSAGAAGTRIRKDFKPLAYYNGSVITDQQGQAQVTFKLPDDLTTWRILAVATDGDFHFGAGEATFITTKPLVTNPLLPQFARPGDRFQAGLAVTNTTEARGTLAIQGSAELPLQFAEQDAVALNTQAATGTRAYRFPMTVAAPGEGQVQFVTRLNQLADAFAVPLAIRPLTITEQVVDSGTTTNRVKLPLNVDEQVNPDVGGLTVTLASTLIPELTAPAQQVLETEPLPCLETLASRLAIAANLQILGQQYDQTFSQFDPAQEASQSLEQLRKLQRPDGGFAAWSGQERSSPWVSPYAAQSLAQAERAFAAEQLIDAAMLNRLRTYLQDILADPGQYDFCKTQGCKNRVRLDALVALADLGDQRTDYLTELYEQRSQLDRLEQFKLAHYLSQLPAWETEAQTLSEQLQETVYETGRSASVNLPQAWSWLSSETATQAQALRLFISRDRSPATLNRLLQGLLNLRRDGTWSTTYDNAVALTALVDYAQLQPEPPSFTAIAQLNGRQLSSVRFEEYRKPSQEVSVPMITLPRGRQNLVLKKSGRGTLHYLAAFRYRLQGNPPGRLNGLRITRQIRPANEATVLHQTGLYDNDEPFTVATGQVFDIGLEIITDHPVDHVLITDSLPAGLEAIDASFQTSTPYFQAQQDSWEIGYQTIHRDRIVTYGDRLDAGVYSLHYLVRSVTPGTFLWPGAEARLQYAPEEFGRCAASTLEVEDS